MRKTLIISLAIILGIISACLVAYKTIEYMKFHPKLVDLPAQYNWLNTDQSLQTNAASTLENMINAAHRDGMCLVVTSGYRDAVEQARIIKQYGSLAVPVGESEHQTGLAVDLTACPMVAGVRDDSAQRPELKNPFNTLPEYQWLLKNASKFGFHQTYGNESWHWKYNWLIF